MFFRLDIILGKVGSKAKDVYESKVSLASRIVKVERSVEDIETKLDNLLEMFIEDRVRMQSMFRMLPLGQPSNSGDPPPGGGGGGGGGSGGGGGTGGQSSTVLGGGNGFGQHYHHHHHHHHHHNNNNSERDTANTSHHLPLYRVTTAQNSTTSAPGTGLGTEGISVLPVPPLPQPPPGGNNPFYYYKYYPHHSTSPPSGLPAVPAIPGQYHPALGRAYQQSLLRHKLMKQQSKSEQNKTEEEDENSTEPDVAPQVPYQVSDYCLHCLEQGAIQQVSLPTSTSAGAMSSGSAKADDATPTSSISGDSTTNGSSSIPKKSSTSGAISAAAVIAKRNIAKVRSWIKAGWIKRKI